MTLKRKTTSHFNLPPYPDTKKHVGLFVLHKQSWLRSNKSWPSTHLSPRRRNFESSAVTFTNTHALQPKENILYLLPNFLFFKKEQLRFSKSLHFRIARRRCERFIVALKLDTTEYF
ncbi:hypothetical protein CDAR_534191 [Caerostris darwini]|uniref:Uncharacterized protein n=1 Tax=Caerostris darwini TaxID=1538125 RepID=A0AAV4S811_9ARAC|nr:hypothetical protein CDAR_534191 [Caerostris darwini]